MSTWRDNPDLMARLTRAQNHPANVDRDVMTFAGFCTDRAELLAHVETCERAIAEYVPPAPRLRGTVTRLCRRAVAEALGVAA